MPRGFSTDATLPSALSKIRQFSSGQSEILSFGEEPRTFEPYISPSQPMGTVLSQGTPERSCAVVVVLNTSGT